MLVSVIYSRTVGLDSPSHASTSTALGRANFLPAGTYYMRPIDEAIGSPTSGVGTGFDDSADNYGSIFGIRELSSSTLSTTGNDVYVITVSNTGTQKWVTSSIASSLEGGVINVTPQSAQGTSVMAMLLGERSTKLLEEALDVIAGYTDTVESTLSSLGTTINTTNSTVGTINTNVNTINSNVSSIKTTVESATFGLSAIKTLIDTVQSTLNTVNTNVSTINTSVGASLGSNVTAIKNLVESGTNGLAVIRAYVDTIETTLSSQTTALTTIDNEIAAIQSSVSTIDTEVGAIQSDATIIKSRVNDIRQTVDGYTY